jgi:hypothetical protein
MADPTPARPPARSYLPLALLFVAGLAVGLIIARRPHAPTDSWPGPGRTKIDQAMVLERLRSTANLVTTEVALRDVVTYQNTRLGSTKRALVVVTGKALVGFDLSRQAQAKVDQSNKLIDITLPHPSLVSTDVVQLKTYDESRGLWNPFYPSDRDTIYQLARDQLKSAAQELEVRRHAEAGAKAVLAALFASSGYSVRVEFVPVMGAATE